MNISLSFIPIFITLLLGAISPGPSFFLVSQTALSKSRLDGVFASLGMGLGTVIFTTLTVFGLQTVLTKVPVFYEILKVSGGIYLMFLAYKIIRNSGTKVSFALDCVKQAPSFKKSFSIGLFTQLSNPKTAIVIGSIMAALLPAQASLLQKAVIIPMAFFIDISWYVIVSYTFSSIKMKNIYSSSKKFIDRVSGSILIILGLKLILQRG